MTPVLLLRFLQNKTILSNFETDLNLGSTSNEWTEWPNCRSRGFARDKKGRGFESRPVRFQVTAMGKLLTRSVINKYNLVPAYGLIG